MQFSLRGENTERLLFRELRGSDFDWWMEFASNTEAVRYFDFTKKLSPEEFCKTWFNKVFERYRNDSGGHNVLTEKTSKRRVGMCGLFYQEVDGIQELEIGYSIHPDFWRKGYATEAARKCKEFAFENNYAESLISIVHVDNIASEKVAKNNGMILEKITEYKETPVKIFRVSR